MQGVKNIIFDLGGVLFNIDFKKTPIYTSACSYFVPSLPSAFIVEVSLILFAALLQLSQCTRGNRDTDVTMVFSDLSSTLV